ncbi:hypothetical protein GALL_439120 [mine drainage metagenome]|uniref:Uncharacterized protein n=1 Tax=mine drainage metagenome TaxID=410659 RepID=A0A1J5PUB4_9ZZZZ
MKQKFLERHFEDGWALSIKKQQPGLLCPLQRAMHLRHGQIGKRSQLGIGYGFLTPCSQSQQDIQILRFERGLAVSDFGHGT